jgi:5-methylcytosine-specific restriction endonuclease McrA
MTKRFFQPKRRYKDNLYEIYKLGAKKRKLTFDLTERKFWDLTNKNCFYCGATSAETKNKFMGVDRINNKSGYVVENCVPCCSRCNWMKKDMNLEEFFIQISRIFRHSIEKTDRAVDKELCK